MSLRRLRFAYVEEIEKVISELGKKHKFFSIVFFFLAPYSVLSEEGITRKGERHLTSGAGDAPCQ